jgi:hypothetical protein
MIRLISAYLARRKYIKTTIIVSIIGPSSVASPPMTVASIIATSHCMLKGLTAYISHWKIQKIVPAIPVAKRVKAYCTYGEVLKME